MANDLGGDMDGTGSAAGPAAEVAAEIGGWADVNDVATVAGAEALIGAALDRFGRIDVLVNHAGIMRRAGPPEVDESQLAAHLAVHVHGSFNTARAAWPNLAGQGYGRIVTTISSRMFGLANNTAYATAKGIVVGLTRSLAVAARKHGITVNCIAPGAVTRMAGGVDETPQTPPELVAPDGGVPRPRGLSRCAAT